MTRNHFFTIMVLLLVVLQLQELFSALTSCPPHNCPLNHCQLRCSSPPHCPRPSPLNFLLLLPLVWHVAYFFLPSTLYHDPLHLHDNPPLFFLWCVVSSCSFLTILHPHSSTKTTNTSTASSASSISISSRLVLLVLLVSCLMCSTLHYLRTFNF